MCNEKYIDENGQEVTILRNGTKEFDEYWSKYCHPIDYSCIIPGEKCPFNKDDFAKELGLIRKKDCEKSEYLLSYFYNNHAERGPFTSWFYEKEEIPELFPVYLEVDVLDMYINNPKYIFHNIEFGGMLYCKERFANSRMLSNRIKFGLAYSNDKKKRAIVCFGHELITLDEHDQHQWIKFLLDSNDFGTNSSYVDYIFGRLNNKYSIFLALLEEISLINIICKENKLPKMFNKEFKDQYENLSGYNVIFQPTKFNLMRFASAMSKILCQQLNRSLFECDTKELQSVDISDEDAITKKEKQIQKAFIEWLIVNNIVNNENTFVMKAKSISRITKLRNIIAHEFDHDEWDEKYWEMQKDIIFDVYDCLREIREGLYRKFHSKIDISYPDSCVVMY